MALGTSDAVEDRMISARNARNKQDKKHPMLIRIDDGSLMPNVPSLAGRPQVGEMGKPGYEPAKAPHPKYRVYTGSLKATPEERMKWLESMGMGGNISGVVRRPVTLADVEPFNIGTATANELIAFAKDEYNVELTAKNGLDALRRAVAKLADEAGAVVDPSLG